MPDNDTKPGRKLPPISPTSTSQKHADVEDAVKPVRKKKKKPATPTEPGPGLDDTQTKSSPRKRTSTASQDTDAGGETAEIKTDPPKKKKKAKPKKTTDTEDQATVEKTDALSNEDVSGSKASLITKGSEARTPRKKAKKKKGVKKSRVEEDEYADSGLAADLTSIADDIVPVKDKEEHVELPHTTSVGILKSQPMDKVYVETIGGFKRKNRLQMAKQKVMIAGQDQPVERQTKTPMELALATIRFLKTFSLFLHGMTAGLAVWQIITVYVLSRFSDVDFLIHYYVLALPVQCTAYLLLALCIVSVCDRFDIGSTSRQFWFQAVTLKNGAISIVFYLVSVILSLTIVSTDDRMHLYIHTPELWEDKSFVESELSLWRKINTARGVFAVLGWVVIAITPNADRLSKNLRLDNNNSNEMSLTAKGVSAA